MRGLWSSVFIVLAACDDAVVLEVHVAPSVPTQKVQLFIGLTDCGSECPGIQPPGVPGVLPGNVYFRDDSNRKTVVRTADVEDGVARFRIEASDVDDKFSLAVVVDEAGTSAAIVGALPLDSAGRYRVDLIAANANGGGLGRKPGSPSGNFVATWLQPPAGPLSCMGFEQWSAEGVLTNRVFIVPENDRDCDGRSNDECATYAYDAVGIPAFAAATCTTSEQIATTSVCWLAGRACDDATGEQHACSPTDYCLPSSYCAEGSTSCGPAGNLDACLFGTLPSAKLKCTIAVQPSADQSVAQLCDSGFEFALLFPVAPAGSPVVCVPPTDSTELLFEQPIAPGPLAFTDRVTFVTKDPSGKMFPLELRLRYLYNGCTYKAELNGDVALQAFDTMGKRVFAQFWTTRGGGAVRKLLVPVEVGFVNGCSTRESDCVLVADDSLFTCVRN